MRLTLFFAALVIWMPLPAQITSDSTLMNSGALEPRSRIIAYDTDSSAATQEPHTSKYIATIGEWERSSLNPRLFESTFTRPFSWIGRQLILRVERASSPYTITINDKEVAHIQNSSLPAEVNITKSSVEGRNTITIILDEASSVAAIEGWQQSSTPSIGEVWVQSQPTLMLRDIEISTKLAGERLNSQITLHVKSHALAEKSSTVHYSLHSSTGELKSFGHQDVTLSMRGQKSITFITSLPQEDGWSAESPQLFTLKLRVQHEGRNVEFHSYRVGFRALEFSPESGELAVNGVPQRLKTKVINTTPTAEEIERIKGEGYNTIRLVAGAASDATYQMCDIIGLYTIPTMPINSSLSSPQITTGENPTNNPIWQGAYLERVDAGFHTAQLHPSVIAFILADNSANGYNLYEGYLRLKGKQSSRAVLYFEATGEWNSDKLELITE